MVQMLQDLHSAVSLPYLVNKDGTTANQTQPAAGISFQELSSGPHKITADATTSQNQVSLRLTPQNGGTPTVSVGQRLIIPTHQIEDDITAVSGSGSNVTVTLAHNLPVAISGTTTYMIVALITDRCAYTVANSSLQWQGSTAKKSFAVLGSDITSDLPFSIPQTAGGRTLLSICFRDQPFDRRRELQQSRIQSSEHFPERSDPNESPAYNLSMKKITVNESASSLAVVLLTIATLAVIVGVTLDYSSNVNRLVQRTTTLQTAVAAADATIEQVVYKLARDLLVPLHLPRWQPMHSQIFRCRQVRS